MKLIIGQVFLLQNNNLFTIESFISCQVDTNCRSCIKEHNVEVGQALFADFFMQRNGNATENYYIFTCLHWHLCSPHQIITNNSALVLKRIPDKIGR